LLKPDRTQVPGDGARRKRALPVTKKKRAPVSQPEREMFARNLKKFRVEAGLSQRELAAATGIAQAHVSDIENAKQNIGLDTMVKLAQRLDKPLNLFFL
jgi:DNA-binding XRE family transcriptional regulator